MATKTKLEYERPAEITCPCCKTLFIKPSLFVTCRHTVCKACCDEQTEGGQTCCGVCGILVKSRDVRMDFNKQKKIDLYKKAMREKYNKEIKSVAQEMLRFKVSWDKEFSTFESSSYAIKNMERSLMKQIEKSENEFIKAVQDRHLAFRLKVKDRVSEERETYLKNKAMFQEIGDNIANMYSVFQRLSASLDVEGIEIDETIDKAQTFLSTESEEQLQKLKSSKASLGIQFSPVLEPSKLLDELQLWKGKSTPSHLFTANAFRQNEKELSCTQFEDVQAENVWQPNKELYDKAASLATLGYLMRQDIFGINETPDCSPQPTAPTLDEDMVEEHTQYVVKSKLDLAESVHKEQSENVRTVHLNNPIKDCTLQHVNVPLVKNKIFELPSGVRKLRWVNNKLWCITEKGFILKAVRNQLGWYTTSDLLSLVLHTDEAKITFIISSVEQTTSGHIVICCSGYRANKTVENTPSLALQEIDESGNIIWVIDNDKYFTDITSCEDSVFALMPQNDKPSIIKWFRHDGEEWDHVGNITTDESICASSVLAFQSHLYLTCANTHCIYATDLSDCNSDDSGLIFQVCRSDLLFKINGSNVRFCYISNVGRVLFSVGCPKEDAFVSIMKENQDNQCEFYGIRGTNISGFAMTKDGDIVIGSSQSKEVFKLYPTE